MLEHEAIRGSSLNRLAYRHLERHAHDQRRVSCRGSSEPAVSSLTLGTPRSAASHGGVRPALVHCKEAPWIHAPGPLAKRGPLRLVVVLGYLRVSLSYQLPCRRATLRPSVAAQTGTLLRSSSASQCALRVSGRGLPEGAKAATIAKIHPSRRGDRRWA
jgi:hypothetical protein